MTCPLAFRRPLRKSKIFYSLTSATVFKADHSIKFLRLKSSNTYLYTFKSKWNVLFFIQLHVKLIWLFKTIIKIICDQAMLVNILNYSVFVKLSSWLRNIRMSWKVLKAKIEWSLFIYFLKD